MLGAAHLWVVGPKKAVWDESKVIYKIFNILNCGCFIKWAMILAVMKPIYAIAYKEASKSQDFKGV